MNQPELFPELLSKVVLGRWGWFWKRIQFWRYRVVRTLVVDDWPKIRRIKYIWRFR
jgi:hypothetical protein